MADVVWVEVKQQAQDGDPVNEWAIVVDNMVEHIEETEQDANRYAAGLRLEINIPAPRTYTVEEVDAAITPLTAELEVTQKDNRLVYEAIGASQVSSRALYVLVKERLDALTAERDELKLLSEDLAVHLQLTLEQSCGAPGTHEALANYREAYPLSARAAKETR
jgi:hypothetical protein